MADISIINKDNTNYNVKDAAGRLALAEVENKGAKNIAEVTAVSSTAGGVDYIVNPDGTVIANRTASSTSSTWFRLNESLSLKAGTYVLSGGKNSGERVLLSPTTSLTDAIADSQGGGVEFTLSEDTDNLIYAIRIAYTDSPSNVKFYPMICTKEEWDISQAYAPYGMTNAELTAEKTDMIDVYGRGIEIPANADLHTYTTPGVYYSPSSARSATLSNCPTTQAGFRLVVTEESTIDGSRVRHDLYQVGATSSNFYSENLASTSATYPDGWRPWVIYGPITTEPDSTNSMDYMSPSAKKFYDDQQRQETEIGVVANAGAKNLLNVLDAGDFPRTINGVTYNESNGIITTSDSATITTTLKMPITLDAGSYIISGCPANGSDSTYRIDMRLSGTNTVVGTNDYGNGFTLNVTTKTDYDCCIRFYQGASAANLTFKPMIRPAAITDTSYQPYARSNPDLTAEMDYVVNAGAKNLIPINNLTTSEDSYCSWTVNADNSITVTPKSAPLSSDWTRFVVTNFVLPAGTYIMSGGIAETSTSNKCDTYIANIDVSPAVTIARGWTDGYQKFTLTQPTHIRFAIRIKTSYNSTTPVTFKPMIRSVEITDPTYQPFARTNRELTVLTDEDRAALVEIVDGGAKNIATINDGNNGTLRYIEIPLSAAAGDYVLQFGSLTSTDTDATTCNVAFFLGATRSSDNAKISRGTNITQIISTTGADSLRVYASDTSDHSQNDTVTISDFMVCTSAAYTISPAFVPYRPSWQEMYERIVALEAQNT